MAGLEQRSGRGQVAVAEVGQRRLPRLGQDRLHLGRRLAVELE
jgi:hypothetical protein